MKKIAFQLHNPCGIINQLMSLEVAVSLQYLTGRSFDVYNIHGGKKSNRSNKIYSSRNIPANNQIKFIKNLNDPSIVDLVDIPNYDKFTFINDDIYDNYKDFTQINLIPDYYFVDKESNSLNDELEFSAGRERLILNELEDYNIKSTLSYYSCLIYNKSDDFNKYISMLNFKKEYTDFAKKISADIGKYSSIHFRLSDHKYYKISREEVLNSINSISKNDKVVIFTCHESNPILQDIPRHAVLFSSIMKNYQEEFANLPMSGDIVYDVISLLVMSMSDEFIGTQGSTYSSYATRYIKDYSYIGIDKYVSKNKYPWVDFPFPYDQKYISWWREWPEYASIAQW